MGIPLYATIVRVLTIVASATHSAEEVIDA